MFLKYCKNVIGAQNMLNIYLGYIDYVFNKGGGGIGASKANLLKMAVVIDPH